MLIVVGIRLGFLQLGRRRGCRLERRLVCQQKRLGLGLVCRKDRIVFRLEKSCGGKGDSCLMLELRTLLLHDESNDGILPNS